MDIETIQSKLQAFASEREWDQFHSLKNLSMALSGEVGELVEIFQWMTEEQSNNLSEKDKQKVTEELADIIIYLLRLADKADIDIEKAINLKVDVNASKYPVEKSKGTSKKYTEL